MKRAFAVSIILALCALAPATLRAQAKFGGQVSWADDQDIGLGARVVASTPGALQLPRLDFIGSFDWFFPGGGANYYEVNGNVGYRISGVTGIAPYVGGGLNIAHRSNGTSNTELGLNLLGGLRFGIGPVVKGFSEVRLELSGGEQFVVTFGVLF
ncbi:MAG: hypothetical protein HYR48_07270 [Gemmatimonadetes bacterium]|nr:hypothetical protein [Gemmatimonadota bacterium]